MERFLRILAYIGNVALLLVLLVLWLNGRFYDEEIILFLLLTILPLLNMWVLWQGPDREERHLRRTVMKAELRQRLRELEYMEAQARAATGQQ